MQQLSLYFAKMVTKMYAEKNPIIIKKIGRFVSKNDEV